MKRSEARRRQAHPLSAFTARESGLTLVELLVASAVLLIVLSAALSMIVAGLRVQRTAEDQSLRIQQTEAVVYLINYEVGLAGYTRTETPQAFSDPTGDTISVRLGGTGESDRLRIRFFEDPDFLPASDSGERRVEYRVDPSRSALIRENMFTGAIEELVGGVQAMKIVAFIDRNRDTLDQAAVEAGTAEIAGVRLTVTFDDSSEWTFLVGLYNRQRVTIVTSGV